MTDRFPRLFTIPSSAPFLRTLLTGLVEGRLLPGFPDSGDPLALAQATLYLPTRRACRLARDLFLDVLGQDAAILPRITPIGDVDEDEFIFAQAAHDAFPDTVLTTPEALGGLERKLLLARLILAWATSRDVRTAEGAPLVANNPTTAFALAGDLARLLDDMTTRGMSWDKLDSEIVPVELDRYWALTLEFLHHIRDHWPAIVAAENSVEPALRRDLLIAAEAERLNHMQTGPVIAAGSTGSMPSTALLLETIARLPNGAVVLPGLDTDLDDASWDMIGGARNAAGQFIVEPAPGHPQFAMQALLKRIGIAREHVTILGASASHGRENYLSEALRPAASTERWKTRVAHDAFQRHLDHALAGVTVIEAANAEEEALAIATALRHATGDGVSAQRTAALITPDRALARRVLAALARWRVAVDDSGGDSLSDTPAGLFARLIAQVALGGCAPVQLLALLKHPLCRLGGPEFAQLPAIALLERAILRGPRPRPGTQGLAHALQTLRAAHSTLHPADPRKALSAQDIDTACDLVARLADALAPLETLRGQVRTLADIAAAHRACIDRVSSYVSLDGKEIAAACLGRDGEALTAIFDEIAQNPSAAGWPLRIADYAELFQGLCGDRVVRRPGAPGARVRIYGPLEARLQDADIVVLGGLAEGVWPPEPRTDPWLSRPMRQQLGLDLPERRIGLSAHDFAQALGAPQVILTRAAKMAGAPTVASRFLQRLSAIAGETRWAKARARGETYLNWCRLLDQSPGAPRPVERPAPTPPLEARPKRLTVTEIEHWLRDPYTIYAKHILKLIALEDVDAAPGARDRGTLIHKAIGDFTTRFEQELPVDPLQELLALGRQAFAPLADYPEAQAFWWPRFERIADWFVRWERERRPKTGALHVEKSGSVHVTPDFELSARADRIECLNDGRYAVLDYKTGEPPTLPQVESGLAPQMTLEAAILRQGGFKDSCGIPAGASVSELLYLRLSGGEPAGKPHPLLFKNATPDEQADLALTRLREVVTRFAQVETPYRSFVRPQWVGRTYSDYDHLARVKEWSATGGLVEGGEE
jgi:ATP-dependent helicase/nuclease subunit B